MVGEQRKEGGAMPSDHVHMYVHAGFHTGFLAWEGGGGRGVGGLFVHQLSVGFRAFLHQNFWGEIWISL